MTEHPVAETKQPTQQGTAKPEDKENDPRAWDPADRVSAQVHTDLLCQSCQYWIWEKDETQNDGRVLHYGRCIIRAPSPPQQPSYQRAVWPKTEGLDGCGEHAPYVAKAKDAADAKEKDKAHGAAPAKEPEKKEGHGMFGHGGKR